jgi:saccharopine dehydrogenase-like NADP-dependent oxidoreductase
MKALVLGAGRVGCVIASELRNRDCSITIVDDHSFNMEYMPADVARYQITVQDFMGRYLDIIKEQDVIVNALPGDISFDIIKKLIPLGIKIVDVSFMPEDMKDLDEEAKFYRTCCLYDCGIAPGLSNMFLGFRNRTSIVDSYYCFAAGLPKERIIPHQFAALFSIRDVIAEYVRPARFKEYGKLKVVHPIGDNKRISQYAPNIGTLEGFVSDGLRSLLRMNIPNMIEYTGRYIGHLDQIKTLYDYGFLSNDNLELTTRVLQKAWPQSCQDVFFMNVRIKCHDDRIYEWTIFDRFTNGVTAMARTTGYTCANIVNWLVKSKHPDVPPGTHAPEEMVDFMDYTDFDLLLTDLTNKGIIIKPGSLA